jgi:DNA-binding transcriptional ArsR family regulator
MRSRIKIRVTGKNFFDKRLHVHYFMVMQLDGYIQAPPNDLDAIFAALADPTRRAILSRLAEGEASVMDLAEPFAMTQPAISKHLKVLERAGLISRSQDAQRRPRRLEARPLRSATQWLEQYRQFWEKQFGRLDSLLHDLQKSDLQRNDLQKNDFQRTHLRANGATRTKRKPRKKSVL